MKTMSKHDLEDFAAILDKSQDQVAVAKRDIPDRTILVYGDDLIQLRSEITAVRLNSEL